MRDQETDRGVKGGLLVDLPLNRSRSSQLSCLGSGIPSLVGGFGSKVIKCGAGSSLSTRSGSREGDRGDPDFRLILYGGRFLSYQVLGRPGKADWIERRCLCLFFIDRIPIICSLRRRRQGRGTEYVLSSTSIRH